MDEEDAATTARDPSPARDLVCSPLLRIVGVDITHSPTQISTAAVTVCAQQVNAHTAPDARSPGEEAPTRSPSPNDDDRDTMVDDPGNIAAAVGDAATGPDYNIRLWRAGRFACMREDFTRLESTDRWLSGDGLAVFAEQKRLAIGDGTVDVVHPNVLQEIQWYTEALDRGDEKNASSMRAGLVLALEQVRRRP